MTKIYFLSFYTNGQDNTYDLTNVSIELRNRLSIYFDDIFLFDKNELKKLPNSEEFCNVFDEELDMNPNANKIGYFDFKPFLIKNILSKIPEGSLLLYHDGNFERNPQYWQTDWQNILAISERLLNENNSDIFCQFERDGLFVKEMVKTYTIDKIFTDKVQNDVVRNSHLINAARLILRNSEFSRKFIDEYLDLCGDKKLLAKSPNDNPDKNFKWSCGDQDVLNCLIYKYIIDGKLQSNFPQYSFLYRVIRFDNRPFDWIGQSWNPHPTGASILLNRALIEYKKNN
jgi:hypothetical protein